MSVGLRFAARSDVGLVRSSNQDSGYAGPHLLVLADGMGGPAGGDIASSVAIAHLAPLDDDVHRTDELLPLLRRAVDAAHAELVDRSRQDPDLKGLGTTCIAVLRSGNKLAMIHIGDSRAYLLRDGHLSQATTDHTFVQYLVDSGRLTQEEAATHPQRNVIMRALGDAEGDVELDESMREARVGDRWLLASDGLFGVVSGATIAQTLAGIEDPGSCGDTLVELALRGGAPDNVTVVVADVVDATDSRRAPDLTPQVVGSAARDNGATSRGGGGSAGRAASLLRPAAPLGEEDDGDVPAGTRPRRSARDAAPRHRARGRIAALAALVGAVVIAAAGYVGYRWTQTQYFVAEAEGNVAVYQGIPQEVGPLRLYHLHERTNLPVDSLTPIAQKRLSSTITRPSLAKANDVVAVLNSQRVEETAEETPDETSTPAPPPTNDTTTEPAGGA